MRCFNNQRLVEARIFNKLTGEDLANRVDIKKQAISQFENGKTQPEYNTILKISHALGFPIDFFYENTLPILQGNTYFRALFSSNKRDLNAQKIKTTFVALIHATLSRFVDFCPYNIPNFNVTSGIPQIAQQLRDNWGLGQEPISDMVGLMERNGIIMSEFASDCDRIDAFYQYGEIDDTPYHCVVLGREKRSFVRQQFSCAHELGHIALHEKFDDLNEINREDFRHRENEANEFASCFLLPKEPFINDLGIYPTKLNRYLELKRKWKVSIAAMVMRARALDIINANQYQYLMRQISQKKWRTVEPLDDYLELKHPKALHQAVNMLLLNNILSGSQFLKELICDGISLPKAVIDEVLNLDPKTIIIDEVSSPAMIIPFAKLKQKPNLEGGLS